MKLMHDSRFCDRADNKGTPVCLVSNNSIMAPESAGDWDK
jgi:hypothetical protein